MHALAGDALALARGARSARGARGASGRGSIRRLPAAADSRHCEPLVPASAVASTPTPAPAAPRAARRSLLAAGAALLGGTSTGDARALQLGERIVIQMGDAEGRLVFEPSQVTLRKGQLYTIEVKNVSSIYHNWVANELLLRGAFWFPLHVEAETGDASWLLWPRQVGRYPYVCTVRGHQNMKGVLEIVD